MLAAQVTSTHISPEFFTHIPELKFISQPFPLNEISKQIQKRDIDTQFELIRAITETKRHKLKLRSNTILENKRNRYPEQSIFEHSRVKLTDQNHHQSEHNENLNLNKNNNFNDYINANYIYRNIEGQSNIILTQAPLKQTATDMINMIIQNKISCVVMLCNVIENGKNRCFDYLNQLNQYESIQTIQKLTQTQSNTNQLDGNQQLQLRRITIKLKDKQQQPKVYSFTHLLYTDWPDKSVPTHPSKISAIVAHCITHKRILIHCSAGLGRSGVIAALYRIIIEIKAQQLNKKQGQKKVKISVFQSVRQLRQDRFGAVQNNQQYRFIYQFLQYYYEKKLSF